MRSCTARHSGITCCAKPCDRTVESNPYPRLRDVILQRIESVAIQVIPSYQDICRLLISRSTLWVILLCAIVPNGSRELAFADDALQPAEAESLEGWSELFDGESLSGWTKLGGRSTFEARDDAIVATCKAFSNSTYLVSKREYADFMLRLEFRIHPRLNAGLMVRTNLTDSRYDPVSGYQVEIDPSMRRWTGAIFHEGGKGWVATLQDNAEARSAFAGANQWNAIMIECKGSRIRSWIQDRGSDRWVFAARYDDVESPTGRICIQLHGTQLLSEPEARFRNLRILPLKDKRIGADNGQAADTPSTVRALEAASPPLIP